MDRVPGSHHKTGLPACSLGCVPTGSSLPSAIGASPVCSGTNTDLQHQKQAVVFPLTGGHFNEHTALKQLEKKVVSFVHYREIQRVTLYGQTQLTKQGITSHSSLGKNKTTKNPTAPHPTSSKNQLPRHKPWADPRPPAPKLTHYSDKTSALPWYAGPRLGVSHVRASIGEPRPQMPPSTNQPHNCTSQLFIVSFTGSSSCEAKWSPLAWIPHTCTAPHRCGRGPRCWWCSRRALDSLSKAPLPFAEHGCSWGKALLPVPSCELFTFLIELWIFLPLQPMIHTGVIFFSIKFCGTQGPGRVEILAETSQFLLYK